MLKKAINVSLGDKSSRRSARMYQKELQDMYAGWEGFDREVYGDESADSSYEINQNDRRARLYQALAQRMAEANNVDLDDVNVRLGGTRFSDYYLGTLKNKRVNALVRASRVISSAAFAPILALMDRCMNMQQADHYNASTNTVNLYHDNPAVLTHELGHAIDFNRRDQADRLARESGDTMDIEQQANVQGGSSVRRAFKDDLVAYRTIQALRRRILPKAYGTYKTYFGVTDDSPYADYGGGDERFKKYESMSYDELYNTLADRLLGQETDLAEKTKKAAAYIQRQGFRKQGLFAPQMLAEGLASRLPSQDESDGTTATRFKQLQMRAARCGGMQQYLLAQAKKKKKTPQQILIEELQTDTDQYKNPFVKQDENEVSEEDDTLYTDSI